MREVWSLWWIFFSRSNPPSRECTPTKTATTMAATGSNEDIPAVEVTGPARINTLWGAMLRDNAKMIIPDLDVLVDYPIDYKFPAFGRDKQGQLVGSGFFPAEPVVLHPVPKTPWSIRAELFFQPATKSDIYSFWEKTRKTLRPGYCFKHLYEIDIFFAQNPFHSKSEIHESEIFKSIAQKIEISRWRIFCFLRYQTFFDALFFWPKIRLDVCRHFVSPRLEPRLLAE